MNGPIRKHQMQLDAIDLRILDELLPQARESDAAGRELYLKQMDGVISRVADIVGARLSPRERPSLP